MHAAGINSTLNYTWVHTPHHTKSFVMESQRGKKITNIQTREIALSFQFLMLSWTVRMLEYLNYLHHIRPLECPIHCKSCDRRGIKCIREFMY